MSRVVCAKEMHIKKKMRSNEQCCAGLDAGQLRKKKVPTVEMQGEIGRKRPNKRGLDNIREHMKEYNMTEQVGVVFIQRSIQSVGPFRALYTVCPP